VAAVESSLFYRARSALDDRKIGQVASTNYSVSQDTDGEFWRLWYSSC